MVFERVVIAGFFQRFFIHIKGFVDFKLEGVEAFGGGGVFLDQFDAFEGVVDGHGVA